MKHGLDEAGAFGTWIGLLLFVLAPRAIAQAQPNGRAVRLVYVRAPGAETCTDEAIFREDVTAQMPSGAGPFVPSAPSLLPVTTAPTRPAAGFQALMELFGVDGRAICADVKQAPPAPLPCERKPRPPLPRPCPPHRVYRPRCAWGPPGLRSRSEPFGRLRRGVLLGSMAANTSCGPSFVDPLVMVRVLLRPRIAPT